MAAEINEITDGNQQHIQSDLHECLRILHRIDRLLTEFEPVMAQFKSPAAAYVSARRARRNGGG